ncbi:hypothetical protein EMPG_15019 [Blastomyces silverae]|uniref:F-box domain-containing protein n=1 Tax=Blastomyces silverae TaxID=2060906 RepID=A0A0H1BK77_9EURO|nr:hypothetical protein EMPG_15019 [Blastomyces silverae]
MSPATSRSLNVSAFACDISIHASLTQLFSVQENNVQARQEQRCADKRSKVQSAASRQDDSKLLSIPPELLLKIASNLGPADKASLALTCKGAYQFSGKNDFKPMDMPPISELWSLACHEPFPMEYERFKFLQGLQRDSRKDIACIWCLKLHPKNQNCSVGCAPSFASERRIELDETTCEWRLARGGMSTGIYMSNFENVDEESKEFIANNTGTVSERLDGRYIYTVLQPYRKVEFPDVSETSGEEFITIRVDYDKVFDRDAFFGPQLKNTSIKVCNHMSFPETPDLWDMVYCKVMNHPEKLSCHKCANAPHHCDKCDAIFSFNVQPLDTFGEMSERYVMLQGRVLRRISTKLRQRAQIRAINSSLPDETTGPFALDSTWDTMQFKVSIRGDFGWTPGDSLEDQEPMCYIPPWQQNGKDFLD